MVFVVAADDNPRQLRSAVMDSLTGPAHPLVIDLTTLQTMGNLGVAVLVSARALGGQRRTLCEMAADEWHIWIDLELGRHGGDCRRCAQLAHG